MTRGFLHAFAAVVATFLGGACAGAPAPNAAIIPSGHSWWCFSRQGPFINPKRVLEPASGTSICMRDPGLCEEAQSRAVQRALRMNEADREPEPSPCREQAKSACYTLRVKVLAVEQVACFAQPSECEWWRTFALDNRAADIEGASTCALIGASDGTQGDSAVASQRADTAYWYCAPLTIRKGSRVEDSAPCWPSADACERGGAELRSALVEASFRVDAPAPCYAATPEAWCTDGDACFRDEDDCATLAVPPGSAGIAAPSCSKRKLAAPLP